MWYLNETVTKYSSGEHFDNNRMEKKLTYNGDKAKVNCKIAAASQIFGKLVNWPNWWLEIASKLDLQVWSLITARAITAEHLKRSADNVHFSSVQYFLPLFFVPFEFFLFQNYSKLMIKGQCLFTDMFAVVSATNCNNLT